MTACVFSKQAFVCLCFKRILVLILNKKKAITSIALIERVSDRRGVNGVAAEEKASVKMMMVAAFFFTCY